MIRCSVVIPTCQQPELLARTLDALIRQTLPPDQYEVIVCDDAASDATAHQLDVWRAASGISALYLRAATPNRGPAAMRNAGWRVARGEIIAFTADDVIPEPEWLRQGLIALDNDAADAASGRIAVPVPDEPTHYERDAARRLEAAGFVAANCFCRRSVLAAIGGFDTRFRAASREDSDLFLSLVTRGLDVVQANDAVVVHPLRPASWGASLRAEQRHMYDALLYKKHRHLYERFISSNRPYLYYAILFALGVAALGAMSDSAVLVAVGLVAWCLLTGALIARRLYETRRDTAHVVEVVVTSLVVPFLSVFWRLRGCVTYRVAFW